MRSMSNRWTPAQLSAINQKNKTLLLSAAAGSGKTSTLTERIIRSITDTENPADISKMLIVTFTRASATDLKTKIFNAVSAELAKNPSSKHLALQLIKLGSANISTIDSFYLASVRKNFSQLGISSSFRIADESETVLIANNVMRDTVNRFYDTEPAFSALCECFEKLRDTEGVTESVLLSLYRDCERVPEGVDYLAKCAEDISAYVGIISSDWASTVDFLTTPYGQILKKYARLCFEDYISLYDDVLERIALDEKLYSAYYAAFDSDRMLCIKAHNILCEKAEDSSYAALASLLNTYAPPALRSSKGAPAELVEVCKGLRDTFKSDLGGFKTKYFCFKQEDLPKFFKLTAENLSLLHRVLSDFDRDYKEEKKNRSILELTDVKRLALRLFTNEDGTPSDVARSLADAYSDIYIDEYQDVDPVQDLIFRSVSTPTNRFMVGDIKQSIYSFRGAMPSLFASYRAAFPTSGSQEAEASQSETIFMSENFRCSKPVIDFTNLVCAPIFRACGDSLGYTASDDLVYSKKLDEGALPDTHVTVALFAKNAKSAIADGTDTVSLPTPAEAEAKYVASEIYKLLKSGKKQDGSPIRPSDIAVLFRNKNSAKRISAALSEYGILTNDSDAVQYFSNPDVLLMLCILNSIDNPQRDIHLAGAMRSPIFGFTLDELLIINDTATASHSLYDKVCLYAEADGVLSGKCAHFVSVLDEWRALSASLPIDKLLSRIFASETFVASGLYTEKNALGTGGNLKRLYEYARTFEAGSFKGLYNFIEFINSLIENGKTIEARSESASDGCVTLTTIHRSKGLEFPVCFVVNAASPFKTGSLNADLTFSYGSGVAMTLSDSTGFATYTSPLKRTLDLEGDFLGVEEEMRVLYVALTRARERLYVTASYPTSVMPSLLASGRLAASLECRYITLGAASYMDWILPRVIDSDCECAKLYGYTTDALPDFCSPEKIDIEAEECEHSSELYEKLRGKFAFEYKYDYATHIPAKLSVSRLSPDVLDSTDDSLELFDVEKDISVPDFFLGKRATATPAERGTATHLFLQFCDFSELCKKGVEHTLSTLVQKRFIPESIAEAVYREELARFCESPLIGEILSAKRIIREQRFNILLPASEFTLDGELKAKLADEQIAVQGVIDLIVLTEDDRLCLYDYKTDRLSREQLQSSALAQKKLSDTHSLQLTYYAAAVKRLFGRAPDRVAIYSTHAARVFEIALTDLKISADIL